MAEMVDTIIVGAGVVGAAVAYALRSQAERTYLIEAEPHAGSGLSSRNSGVIHAGIYYPPDSLKTRFCQEGAAALYAFAERFGVPYLKTGKYIVANDEAEIAQLAHLKRNAPQVPLHYLDSPPAGVAARATLFSPNTGIIDTHSLIERLIEQSKVPLLCNQKVTEMNPSGERVALCIEGETYSARQVINCSGLSSAQFAADTRYYWAKGSYFQLTIPAQVQVPELVYPAVPKNGPSLGIHLTRNIYGEAYLGPDIEWVAEPNDGVDPKRREQFYDAAKRYLPWLEPGHLQPGYAGVRPKLARQGFQDFRLKREGERGQLIHCLGIESPGITAALALAAYVGRLLDENSQ